MGDNRVWNVSKGVQGSPGVHGEHLSFSLSPSHPSCTHSTSRFRMVARGERNSMYLNVTVVPSHLCRCRNEVTGAKRACWGTAGCRRVFHWLFISPVVRFIDQLWVLCFVSLLYAQYKVIINSIWERIYKKTETFCNIFSVFFRKLSFVFVKISSKLKTVWWKSL